MLPILEKISYRDKQVFDEAYVRSPGNVSITTSKRPIKSVIKFGVEVFCLKILFITESPDASPKEVYISDAVLGPIPIEPVPTWNMSLGVICADKSKSGFNEITGTAYRKPGLGLDILQDQESQ
jgi:hypothetical protein